MNRVQLLLIIVFCTTISRAMAQDTVIIRRNVEIINPNFLMIMDSVISHAKECVCVNEVPSCIIVEKEKWRDIQGEDIDCYRFSIVPIDNSEMHHYEAVLKMGVYYPFHYKSYLFLFKSHSINASYIFDNDTNVLLSNMYDTIIADTNQWAQYLYMANVDNPSHLDMLKSVDIYRTKDLTLFKRIPCEDVSDMIRIIDTPHTKLFIPPQPVRKRH